MKYIHRITIWTRQGFGPSGAPEWSFPCVVDGRWEDITTVYRTESGDQATSNSRVYLDFDATVGDFILLGESEQLTPERGSKEVRQFRKIWDVSGTQCERRVLV